MGADNTPELAGFSQNAFIDFLLDRGLVGFAWATSDFEIQGTLGSLASWIGVGDKLTEDLAPFVGLEDDLNELRDDFRPSFVLSNIGINIQSGDVDKASLEVFWQEQTSLFVVVLHQLGGQPEFEADLARQLRGRRLAEEQLATLQRRVEQKQHLLDVIAEFSPVALAVQDAQRSVRFATERWIETFGTGAPAVTLESGDQFVDDLTKSFSGLESTGWSTPPSAQSDVSPQKRQQAWKHRPWLNQAGRIEGVVSALHPVDDMMAEVAHLRARVADLERMNSDLESFAALLAHDVRAPLSGLRTRLMSAVPTEAQSSVESEVDAALARVQQIADGLLEFSTMTGLAGPTHAVDLRPMIHRICEDSVNGTEMQFHVEGTWPVMTTAVAPLDIVLRNLVQNAVRHHDTKQGMVSVTASAAESVLCIEIRDDGPGIPLSQQSRIFDPMTTFATPGTPSTGLGLAFVKRAAESVGAKIVLKSQPTECRGTTFAVHWPMST